MKGKLISILMPVRNVEKTINPALRSVLDQSYKKLEVIVVDDGSIDRTPTLLDEWKKKDSRIRVISTEQRGIVNALNKGITECSGDYIARMDGDDISHQKRLELQYCVMEEKRDVSVVSSLVRMFPRSHLQGGLLRYEEWLNSLKTEKDISRDMFVESPVAHPSVMLRTEELIEFGGYRDNGWAEDYDLWLRYHMAGKTFLKIQKPLLYWRHTAGRLTFSDSRYSIENFIRAKAHYLALLLRDESREIVLWGAGKTGKRLLKHLQREDLSIEKVIDIDKRKIGGQVRSVEVISPEELTKPDSTFVIAAVSSHGAREMIRATLEEKGYIETVDFVCAA